MFERFTEGSRGALLEAQELAQDLGSTYLTAGHLLYGCAAGGHESAYALRDCGITATSLRRQFPRGDRQSIVQQVDPEALRAIGIDYQIVLGAVEETFGPGALESAPDRRNAGARRKPKFTPQAKRALELSLRVALELRDKSIVPGHLLLALLRLDDDFVMEVLDGSGTTVAAVSAAVLTRMAAAA
jgi:ATP-dependent Clp protease ATP-binding subunit ClpA